MELKHVRISVKGKPKDIPAIDIEGTLISITGKMLKIARIHGEKWEYGDGIRDIPILANQIKRARLGVDIFTFSQKLPNITPAHNYHLKMDNFAVIHLSTFEHWWKRQIPYSTRKAVNKSNRMGVITKIAVFDDTLVNGIADIYNESPVRQGKPFWHYGKSMAVVREENQTYLDRSEFIGAYFQGELIGFIKLIYCGNGIVQMMQIISKLKYFDKSPTNALLAKAVEVCSAKEQTHLVYGQYIYGRKTKDSLVDFKSHNGFVRVDVPRYFIPLSVWGRIALYLNLHDGLGGILPEKLQYQLLRVRSKWYEKRSSIQNLSNASSQKGV